MPLRAKLLLSLVSIAVVPVILFGLIGYQTSTSSLIDVERDNLQGALDSVERAQVIAPALPLAVASGATETASLFILLPTSAFHDGERRVSFTISDGAGYRETFPYRLVGPEHDDHGDRNREHNGEQAP